MNKKYKIIINKVFSLHCISTVDVLVECGGTLCAFACKYKAHVPVKLVLIFHVVLSLLRERQTFEVVLRFNYIFVFFCSKTNFAFICFTLFA